MNSIAAIAVICVSYLGQQPQQGVVSESTLAKPSETHNTAQDSLAPAVSHSNSLPSSEEMTSRPASTASLEEEENRLTERVRTQQPYREQPQSSAPEPQQSNSHARPEATNNDTTTVSPVNNKEIAAFWVILPRNQ